MEWNQSDISAPSHSISASMTVLQLSLLIFRCGGFLFWILLQNIGGHFRCTEMKSPVISPLVHLDKAQKFIQK
jgi:hypothetical protein